MSGYGSMKASPFWRGVMRITGILCFATLMTPPAYFLKYAVMDRPGEAAIASSASTQPASPPVEFRYAVLEQDRAEHGASAAIRTQAIAWLVEMDESPYAQMTHPFECMISKATLGTVGTSDPDPGVKIAADNALVEVASRGAVIKR
jgi:hypothetical protein